MEKDPISEKLGKISSAIPKTHELAFEGDTGVSMVNSWVIGPYRLVSSLRRKLKWRPNDIIPFVKKNQLRFGRRAYDVWTKDKAKSTSFVSKIENKTPKLVDPEIVTAAKKKGKEFGERYIWNSQINGYTDRRRIEQYQEIEDFYLNKTLEAHHIVEDHILQKVFKEKSPTKQISGDASKLIRSESPTVLIAAEMHQRLFTTNLSKYSLKEDFKKQDLLDMYNKVYELPEMADLKKIAEIIINSIYLE